MNAPTASRSWQNNSQETRKQRNDMRLLFVHQNFPGQYKHIAPLLAVEPGNRVVALCINASAPAAGVEIVRYAPTRGSTKDLHPWLGEIETKIIRGEAAARAAIKLREQGFTPDLICTNPGWGENLFLKEVWPDTPILCLFEFYYHAKGADVGFDPEYPDTGFETACKLRMKNTHLLLSLDSMDWGLSPTEWQCSQLPALYRPRISVIHDGIDTRAVAPNPEAFIRLESLNLTLRPGDPVVTFVNRNMEPYRGFHSFMRAVPLIQQRCPNARIFIVGGDDVSYGSRLPDGQTYKQKYLAEVGGKIDLSRVHFVGRIAYGVFLSLLQVSAVHVYLTYPFVLSWSMLEAMSAECLVVGSMTPPVEEVIEDGVNGVLVDFFSPEAIAEAVRRGLERPEDFRELRRRARQTVIERYDLETQCLPRQLELIRRLAGGSCLS
jgi:glycosyltransferase involved in cell wall biosynthesis